jgi:hypothetical protein
MPTATELLRAAEHLSEPEFEDLLFRLLNLRARRIAPSLPEAEAGLLRQINESLPEQTRRRYRRLIARRRAGTLTPPEQAELLTLTDQEERHNLQRVQALAALAQLRRKPVTEVMRELDLKTLHDD